MRKTYSICLFLVFGFSGLFLLSSCGEKTVQEYTGPATCNGHADCPVGKLCQNGVCQSARNTQCTSDANCPPGFTCLSDGTCQANVGCQTDTDCCPPEVAGCKMTCVDFQCIGTDCTSGDDKSCQIGCHKGQANCISGSWSLCDAPIVTNVEICDDSIDNDCNGKVDDGCFVCQPGNTIVCTGACGNGIQTCDVSGQWGKCDSPVDCLCQPGESTSAACEKCGVKEATCGPEGKWIWSTICSAQGVCEPTDEDFGDCGKCGQQKRVCDAECTWDEWSKCGDEGECVVGAEEQEGCGNCGAMTRTCDNECKWGEYGACLEGGGCTVGEKQTQACGDCGTKTSVCDTKCQWSEFGSCLGEGPCSPAEVETESCGNCGTKTRVCNTGCGWTAWGVCKTEGPCAPAATDKAECGPSSELGICEYGEKVRTCSLTCKWNPWGNCLGAIYPASETCGNGIDEDCNGADLTAPDEYETAAGNNTCATCYWLGTDPDVTIYPTIDNPLDTDDYFCFQGNDGTSVLPESISVKVSGQPPFMDVDLHLYRGLANCESSNSLDSSVTIGNDDEEVYWQESFATSETDTYYVKVSNWGDSSCYLPYTLKVKGLK
jgi:hypothetical protein